MKNMSEMGRTFAFVDLNAIRENGEICRKTFSEQNILSVLKADAYGHGIEGVMSAFEDFSDYYAVATVEEALLVRKHTDKPILLFGSAPSGQMALAAEHDITFTVGCADYARRLSKAMRELGRVAKCHLKIETGLNRSGIRWRDGEEALREIISIHALPNLSFVGTYTHFACGEGLLPWEVEFTSLQFSRFNEAITAMERAGLSVGLRHCCSTGGALVNPDYRLDMVRLGMMPLGMSYSDESVRELGLTPSMKWVGYITMIEPLPAGDAVSYGCLFKAEKDMRIAMVSCGYADGYRRAYSNKTSVLLNGRRVSVLGRVAMDCMMIDVTDVDCNIGDEVILLGTDGTNTVSAQELMMYGESVSGEVTAAISQRVKRIYING